MFRFLWGICIECVTIEPSMSWRLPQLVVFLNESKFLGEMVVVPLYLRGDGFFGDLGLYSIYLKMRSVGSMAVYCPSMFFPFGSYG